MKSFMSKILGIKPKTQPKIGEIWILKGDASPWKSQSAVRVTITDVKSGWVRYDMECGFSDQRMKLDTFVAIYTKAGQ